MNGDKCFIAKSLLLVAPLCASACSASSGPMQTNVLCENVFNLVSDFNHRFPEQDDYMLFLKSGRYETYYYPRSNGFTCHFHLEYQTGEVIDDWGTYICDGKTLRMQYPNAGLKTPYFSTYHSSTIDFHIIDTLEHEGQVYKVVYQARYLYSAKG